MSADHIIEINQQCDGCDGKRKCGFCLWLELSDMVRAMDSRLAELTPTEEINQ